MYPCSIDINVLIKTPPDGWEIECWKTNTSWQMMMEGEQLVLYFYVGYGFVWDVLFFKWGRDMQWKNVLGWNTDWSQLNEECWCDSCWVRWRWNLKESQTNTHGYTQLSELNFMGSMSVCRPWSGSMFTTEYHRCCWNTVVLRVEDGGDVLGVVLCVGLSWDELCDDLNSEDWYFDDLSELHWFSLVSCLHSVEIPEHLELVQNPLSRVLWSRMLISILGWVRVKGNSYKSKSL